MAGELVGWKNTLGRCLNSKPWVIFANGPHLILVLLPYGARFRRYRKLFHNLIGSQCTIKKFLPAEELETRRFLRRVLAKPSDLSTHIRKSVPS